MELNILQIYGQAGTFKCDSTMMLMSGSSYVVHTVTNVVNGGGVEEEAAAVVGGVREWGAVDADNSAIGENL